MHITYTVTRLMHYCRSLLHRKCFTSEEKKNGKRSTDKLQTGTDTAMHLKTKCNTITIHVMLRLDRCVTDIAKFAKTFLNFCFRDSMEQTTNI